MIGGTLKRLKTTTLLPGTAAEKAAAALTRSQTEIRGIRGTGETQAAVRTEDSRAEADPGCGVNPGFTLRQILKLLPGSKQQTLARRDIHEIQRGPRGEWVLGPRKRDGQRGRNTLRVRFIRGHLSLCYLQTS